MNRMSAALTLGAGLLVLIPASGTGQWRNRYPHVRGYGHHVYLEGYELPILTNGPIDPAPSPDGRRVAFAARGWIWLLDLESASARRLTSGPDVDSRPAWHPSGDRLAIVRDNDHDTRIVIVNAETGADLRTIDSPALDLDPAFSPDGGTLHYTSGQAGTLDVWALDLATGESVPLTADPGLEMRPQPLANGSFLTLAKRGGDRVELRYPDGGEPRVLVSGNIASMARPAVSPSGAGLRAQLAHPGRLGPPHPRCRAARRLRAADRRRIAAHPLVEPGRALDLLLRGRRERGHASQADPRGRRAGRGGGHPGVAMGGWDGPRPHPDPCEHVAVPGPGPHQRIGPKRASRGPGPGGRPLRRVQRSRLLLQSGADRGHGSRGRGQRLGSAGARHPGGERDRDGGGRWRHRGGAGADPRLGRPCRRMGLGRPPLPPQLRRALRPRPIRPDPQDGGRGAGIRDTAPRQSAQPLRGPGSLGLGEVGRAALHPLRAGDPVALPRPHRAAGDPRAALAVGVGTGLRGLRDRRSHQRGGARPRAPHRRIRLLRPPRVGAGSLRGRGRRQGSRRTRRGRRHGRCGCLGGDVPLEQLRGHRGPLAPLPQPRRGDRAVRGNRRDAQPLPHDGGRRHARVRPHRGSPELAGLSGRAARGPFVRDQRPALSGLPGRPEGERRRRSGPGHGSRRGHRVRSGRS